MDKYYSYTMINKLQRSLHTVDVKTVLDQDNSYALVFSLFTIHKPCYTPSNM